MDSGIVISGIRPYDGEYEFDLGIALSAREWRWIKQISGYMPLTLEEGLDGGDPAVICALAVIALVRNGKVNRDNALVVAETLIDAPFEDAHIKFVANEIEEVEVDDPPEMTSEPEDASPSDSLKNGTTDLSIMPSGSNSMPSLEASVEIPSRIGASR